MYSLSQTRHRIASICLFTSASLIGCGGGGGGGSSSELTPQTNIPAIATESEPIGPVIDLSAYNLFPLSRGDAWIYDIVNAGGAFVGRGDRVIASSSTTGDTTTGELLEVEHLNPGSTMQFAKTNNGVFIDYTTDAAIPPQAAQQIGLIREYAFPTYAIGETRTVVRQGAWDEDLDGDGKFESFRIEYEQIFHGFDSQFAVPWGIVNAAMFTNTYRFTLTKSGTGEVTGVVTKENAYLAENYGPVKFVRHAEDLSGKKVKSQLTWTIKELTVGGNTLKGL